VTLLAWVPDRQLIEMALSMLDSIEHLQDTWLFADVDLIKILDKLAHGSIELVFDEADSRTKKKARANVIHRADLESRLMQISGGSTPCRIRVRGASTFPAEASAWGTAYHPGELIRRRDVLNAATTASALRCGRNCRSSVPGRKRALARGVLLGKPRFA
jgi:hypothetical protein